MATVEERIASLREKISSNGHPTYTVETGHELFTTDSRKATSELDKNGIRVLKRQSNGTKDTSYIIFICLHDGCQNHDGEGLGRSMKCAGRHTGNGTRHLNDMHGIQSQKTAAAASTIATFEKLVENSSPGYKADPDRFFANAFGVLAATHCIPYNAFKGPTWNLIAHHIPTTTDKGLKNLDLRKPQVEQYHYMKSRIIAALTEAKRYYEGLPFLSINIDLYQNKVSNQKYIAIRVSWSQKGTVMSYNLAIREYSPTFAERQTQQASELLVDWTRAVLDEFHLKANASENDFLTGSGDSGSDVKRAMDVLLGIMREWCVSHLLHRLLLDGYGASVDKKDSKNLEAREVIEQCRKTVESVNKSEDLKLRFNELQKETVQMILKLKNSPVHRWGNIEETFESLLMLWQQLETAFLEQEKLLPIGDNKQVLLEFYSLLYQVRGVQKLSQKFKEFVAIKVYFKLIALYISVLKNGSSLRIRNPVRRSLNAALTQPAPREVNLTSEQLDPRTRKVRKLLRKGLNTRFMNRYHPIFALDKWRSFYGVQRRVTTANVAIAHFKFDYVFELMTLFYPTTRDLQPIRNMCNEVDVLDSDIPRDMREKNIAALRRNHFKLLEAALWGKVKSLAIIPASKMVNQLNAQEEQSEERSPDRQRRRGNHDVDDEDMLLRLAGINVSPARLEIQQTSTSAVTAESIVADEIKRYQEMRIERSDYSLDKLDAWWSHREQQNKFPCLSKVATALFGMLPGSGGLECDIGGVGDVISPKRGSLDPGLVEVQMMIRLHKTLKELDSSAIPDLGKTWKNYIPKRPAFPAAYFDDDDGDDDNQNDGGDNNDDENDSDSDGSL